MIITHSDKSENKIIIYPYWENDKNIYESYPDDLSEKLEIDKNHFNKKLKKKRYFLNDRDITVINLGDKKEIDLEVFRQFCSIALDTLKKDVFANSADIYLFEENFEISKDLLIESCILSFLLSDYLYIELKSKINDLHKIEKINLVLKNEIKEFNEIHYRSTIIAQSVYFSRDIVNGPANIVTIDYMINAAKKISKEDKNITINIMDTENLKANGMNLILAVGNGGAKKPVLIEMSYKADENAPEICLIGKGIIFDTGGLDLKPSKSLLEMKTDMAGAAAVLSIISASSKLKLKANITALIPLAENSIDKESYRPGDVFKAFNGKTVEIKNTDAEGRLILADALSYSDMKDYDVVIDIATLTGAAIIALGNDITACFIKNENLKEGLFASSKITGEPLWELPLYNNYKDMLKSDIADVSNIGDPPRVAGCILGALFLNEFIENDNWIHLDIAGPSYIDKDYYYNQKGATGVIVRTILEFIKNFKK